MESSILDFVRPRTADRVPDLLTAAAGLSPAAATALGAMDLWSLLSAQPQGSTPPAGPWVFPLPPATGGAPGNNPPPVPRRKPQYHPPNPAPTPRPPEPDPNLGGVDPELDLLRTGLYAQGLLGAPFAASAGLAALGPLALLTLPGWMLAAFGNNSEARFGQNPMGS